MSDKMHKETHGLTMIIRWLGNGMYYYCKETVSLFGGRLVVLGKLLFAEKASLKLRSLSLNGWSEQRGHRVPNNENNIPSQPESCLLPGRTNDSRVQVSRQA